MAGIAAARGEFVLMGDADDSYDFQELTKFLPQLSEGYDLVQGCRLPSGGGVILPRRHAVAAPLVWQSRAVVHRQSLVPGASSRHLLRVCGRSGAKVSEHLPAALHRHGIRDGDDREGDAYEAAHRRSAHYAAPGRSPIASTSLADIPRWLEDVEILSAVQSAASLPLAGRAIHSLWPDRVHARHSGITLDGATFDAHTLLFASLALLTRLSVRRSTACSRRCSRLEKDCSRQTRGLNAPAVVAFDGGRACSRRAWPAWPARRCSAVPSSRGRKSDFGRLNYASTMRIVVPGVTLFSLGIQTMFAAFLLGVMELRRR